MRQREISPLPASCGSPVFQRSLASASLKQGLKCPRNLGLVAGKGRGDNCPPQETGKACSQRDLLKELRQAAEGGKACALAAVTSDSNAACEEQGIARGEQLHCRVVCCSCKLCHLAHIWLTQLDHLTQVFYFSA